ncbi:hypothetical protein PG993_011062 [Apiospora rasikravindrae]|uniref:RING-type domain-containing protein n=1 Tax=Apiospora rasikravindrae TaxID=990691 RepID=A0ABR1SD37_9PEZI
MDSSLTPAEHDTLPPKHQTARIIAVAVSVSCIVMALFAIILFGHRRKTLREPRGPPRGRRAAVPTRKIRPEQALGQKAVDHIPIIKYHADSSSPPQDPEKSEHVIWAGEKPPSIQEQERPRAAFHTRLWHMLRWRRPEEEESAWHPSMCSICTEDFRTGDKLRNLPCGHLFHPVCIDPWLCEQSRTCPLWYVWTLPKNLADQ